MAQDPMDVRLALLSSGYDPLPLRGKRPAMNAWTGVVADPQLIRLWSAHNGYPDAVNTGVLTRRTPGLDLDVLNPECVEAMIEHIRDRFEEGGRILPRIGRWPKCLIPFRTDEPFKKITLPLGRGEEKIEFLSDGQQFVSFGVHPDTHEAYRWPRGSILEVAREELPYIRQADAEDEVRELGKIATTFGYNPKPKHNGNGGTAWEPTDIEELTRAILAGESLHNSVLKIAGSYAARGSPKSDCIDYIGLAFTAAQQPRYGNRWDECNKAISYCYAKEGEKQPPPPPTTWITGADLTSTPAPAQEWTVKDLIPARQVCLFTGHGGTGKSTLGLHLAAAHALGRAWLNFDATPGPAFFIDAEDDLDTLHRRLDSILELYGAELTGDLANLHILSLTGKDAVLATCDRNGLVHPTPLYEQIRNKATEIKPVQIVIGPAAMMFGGNEIVRTQVMQFLNLMTGLALASGGSVILIAHPSRKGMEDEDGLSGSTQWHNGVRSRLYLHGDGDGLLQLELKKSQYGPPAEAITLQWRNGLFLPVASTTPYEQAAREQAVDHAFLAALRRLRTQKRNVSPNKGPTYAPTQLEKCDECKTVKASREELAAAMERLLKVGTIVSNFRGPPSHQRSYLEPSN